MKLDSFEDLIPNMRRAGFIATALSAVITAKFGWSQGEDFASACALAGLLALATFIVGYSLVFAYHAFKRGEKVIGGVAIALFAIGVVTEFVSHTSFNASNKDATIQKASFETELIGDKRSTVKQLEEKLATLNEEKNSWKPVMTVGDARAKVQSIEARPIFENTERCTKTPGAQSRKICAEYNTAQAAITMWDQIAKQEIKIGETEAALKDARGAMSGVQLSHASGASQNAAFASMATLSTKPNETQMYWASIGLAAWLAIFAIAAGGLLNVIAFAFDVPGAKKASEATEKAVQRFSDAVAMKPAEARYENLLSFARSA